MDFYIRQGATSPILKMKLVSDSRADESVYNDLLENSSITFEMFELKTGKPVLLNEKCEISLGTTKFDEKTKNYYITYQFTEEGTATPGKFEGKMIITFLDTNLNPTSKLIVPIREKLYINII